MEQFFIQRFGEKYILGYPIQIEMNILHHADRLKKRGRRRFHDRLSLDHCADKLLTVHNGFVHHRIQPGKLCVAQIHRDLVVPRSVWLLVFCGRGFRVSPDK